MTEDYKVRYYDNFTPEDFTIEFTNEDEAEDWINETMNDLADNYFNNVDYRRINCGNEAGIYEINGDRYAYIERLNFFKG